MTKEELFSYATDCVGVPYNDDPDLTTHSLETGFNCFSWGAHLYALGNLPNYNKYPQDLLEWRALYKDFARVEIPEGFPRIWKQNALQFLDTVIFYRMHFGRRHLGVMLDDLTMTHCCSFTNGVSIAKLNSTPWDISLKGAFRCRSSL